jgi:hypothetical protein
VRKLTFDYGTIQLEQTDNRLNIPIPTNHTIHKSTDYIHLHSVTSSFFQIHPHSLIATETEVKAALSNGVIAFLTRYVFCAIHTGNLNRHKKVKHGLNESTESMEEDAVHFLSSWSDRTPRWEDEEEDEEQDGVVERKVLVG